MQYQYNINIMQQQQNISIKHLIKIINLGAINCHSGASECQLFQDNDGETDQTGPAPAAAAAGISSSTVASCRHHRHNQQCPVLPEADGRKLHLHLQGE